MAEPEQSEVVDNPAGWVASHISEYVATGGKQGHLWNGATTLLLMTRGRKTGVWRRTALIYGQDGDDYLVVGSMGGAPTNPKWYSNLVANPNVRLQVKNEEFEAVARTADDEERARFWPIMTKIWPDYDAYEKRTTRRIPVVALRRV
jgi:deazaflavin-dependent oxidoreductase (nitroreductase family)